MPSVRTDRRQDEADELRAEGRQAGAWCAARRSWTCPACGPTCGPRWRTAPGASPGRPTAPACPVRPWRVLQWLPPVPNPRKILCVGLNRPRAGGRPRAAGASLAVHPLRRQLRRPRPGHGSRAPPTVTTMKASWPWSSAGQGATSRRATRCRTWPATPAWPRTRCVTSRSTTPRSRPARTSSAAARWAPGWSPPTRSATRRGCG